MNASEKDAGFTLVEVLISLFIFALISAGTMGAMLQTFAAKDRLNIASAELADIAAFRSIMRADMNALTLRPMRDGVGGTENFFLASRNPAEPAAILSFSRLGRSNPTGAPRGQVERVRYIFREGQFIRETLGHENPAQREGWSGRVLLENLQNVKLRYVSRGLSDFVKEEDLLILNDPLAPKIELDGAIEITLRAENGVETEHLFEIGS